MAQINSVATIVPFAYPNGFDNTQRTQIVRGKITLSPGQYPPGGFTLNWGGVEGIRSLPPTSSGALMPVDVTIKSVGNIASTQGTGPSGYIYLWDNVNGNFHIFEVAGEAASGSSGPLVEIGGGISGTIFADTIQFEAIFARE